MIRAGEVMAGLYGAWRLARRDPKGLAWFDGSARGAMLSFWAQAICLPAYLLLRGLDGTFSDELARPLVVELIAYVIDCVAFPLAVAHLSEVIGRGNHYCRYLAAYNWSSVIQMVLFLPVQVMVFLFPEAGLAPLAAVAAVILLVYQAYVAHLALEVKPATAAMLVLLDLVIDALIQTVSGHLTM